MEMISIGNEDFLLRRIPNFPSHIKPDGTIARTSFSLKKGEDGISTDLERLTTRDVSVLDRSRYRLARINVGFIKNQINDGLDCKHNPLLENIAHTLIVDLSGEISKSKSRAMAINAEIII